MKTAGNQKSKADILDVAREARVSASTVSRCFNHPDLVRPATRHRIEEAVKRLGYIRNRAAQAMHGRRSATIGLVVPTINHAIFAEVIDAFSEAVDGEGFTILVASHRYDLDREYALLRKFLEHRVDGVALIGLEHAEESHQLIAEQGVPAIAMWNYAADARIPCVGAENAAAGRMAAEHLIALGHRRIGMLFPSVAGNDRARDRRAGALDVLDGAGVAVPERWQVEVPYSLSQAKEAATALLGDGPRPTALLCGNDVIAQGALFACRALGIDVPGALSVMGIGDFRGSAEMEPALSTIRIPAERIGQIAGEIITRAIAGEQDDPLNHRCDLELMVRGTTAPV